MSNTFKVSDSSYGEFLVHFLKEHPNALLGEPSIDKVVNFKQLLEAVNDVAENMENNTLSKGDIVHFVGKNSIALCVSYCSLAFKGWIPVGSSSSTPLPELIANINNTFSNGLLISKEIWDKISDGLTSHTLKIVFVYELIPQHDLKVKITKHDHHCIERDDLVLKDDLTKVSFMFMTSGSTGSPKSVMVDHRQYFRKDMGLGLLQSKGPQFTKSTINCQPFANAGGKMCFIMSVISGHNLMMFDKFDEESYLNAFVKYECNYIFATPAIINSLSKFDKLSDYDLSGVRLILCGGAKLDVERVKFLKERSKMSDNVLFVEGYGSSESGSSFFRFSYINDIKEGFPISESQEIKLINVKTGKECESEEEGELWVKSPATMLGYMNDETKTRSVLTDDGFYKTGDLCYIKENTLFISGRLKEVIKYRAFSVNASELEKVLVSHPLVAAAGVIAEPHEDHGEIPVAFVVSKSEIGENDLIVYVAKHVAEYKQIRKVYFVSHIPLNNGNKVDKNYLRKYLKDMQEN